MPDRSVEKYPQWYARSAGALYLVTIVFGAFDEGYLSGKLLVPGDAVGTAHNIMASAGLWTLGAAGNLIIPIIAVVGVWISYLLLRPVSKNGALLNVFFGLVSLAVEAISKLFLLLVVPILGTAGYADAFEPRQLEILANLALKSHGIVFNIALIFFGSSCIVEGYLLFKSGYFPKFVGLLMQLAGVCYLISCFAALFAPAFADLISPAILLPIFIGESTYCLWLLVKGVNVTKWNERIAAATAFRPQGTAI